MPRYEISPIFILTKKKTLEFDLKNLRRELGTTQIELAEMLGVSRAILSMVEIGQRTLPDHALLKLSRIQRKLEENNSNQTKSKSNDVYGEEQQKEIDQHIEKVKGLLFIREKLRDKAKGQLIRMRMKNAGALESIRLVEEELKLFEGIETYTGKLNIRRDNAIKLNEDTHPVKQLILQLRLAEMEAMVTATAQELNRLLTTI